MLEFVFSSHALSYQSTDPSVIAVSTKGRIVTVTISKSQELRTVIDRVCTDLQLECEGTSYASIFQVVPLRVSGSLTAVVAKLLEGTGLNYSAVAAGGAKGKIAITPPRSGANNSSQVGIRTVQVEPVLRPQQPGNAQTLAESGNTLASHPFPMQPISADVPLQSSGGPSQPRTSRADPVSMVAVPHGSGPASESMAGKDGEPIYVNQEGTSGEPMMDKNGQPIPVVRNTFGVEPLPDSRGNPIPVSVSARPPQ